MEKLLVLLFFLFVFTSQSIFAFWFTVEIFNCFATFLGEINKILSKKNLCFLSRNSVKREHILFDSYKTAIPLSNARIDGEDIEIVENFVYLGSIINEDSSCVNEITRRISMGKCAVKKLMKIWRDRGISRQTKINLMNVLVFPIVSYGSESWIIRKAERKKLDSFDLWCWRRLLRILWMQKKTNRWIVQIIQPNNTLESRILQGRLRYFGHVCRSIGLMERDILLGQVEGRRRRGRPRTRWLDGVLGILDERLSTAVRRVNDRSDWRTTVTRVTRGRTRLDGTRWIASHCLDKLQNMLISNVIYFSFYKFQTLQKYVFAFQLMLKSVAELYRLKHFIFESVFEADLFLTFITRFIWRLF